MTFSQARKVGGVALDRLKRTPLPLAGGLAAGMLALILLAAVGFSGPSYAVLFDGLTPGQGGTVIGELQKLGIPYKLSGAGNVIEVPKADLGRARLELGAAGDPSAAGTLAARDLVKAPMTASNAAIRAMEMQSSESQIEASIRKVTGARYVRVLLAIPRYTPFLGDQPQPKASVVLAGAPEADTAMGLAVARLVAGAVPGLSTKDVVVETEAGKVLYPMTRAGTVAQQFAIQRSIEASDEVKIREILTPVFGASSYRVAVSSDVGFSRKTIDNTQYGPRSFPTSDHTVTKKTVGPTYPPMGIPGALSNQPPGPTAAPVTKPVAARAAGTANGPKKQKAPAAVTPKSSSRRQTEQFVIDQTRTLDRLPAWHIKRTSVSVVVTPHALGKLTAAAVRSMVAAAIGIPVAGVAVTTAEFVVPDHASARGSLTNTPLVIRAVLLVLGAIAAMLGVVLPGRRWLSDRRERLLEVRGRREGAERVAGAQSVLPSPVSNEQRLLNEQFQEIVGRVKGIADVSPSSIARTLQNWSLEPAKKEP